jgi:hypothetical protein
MSRSEGSRERSKVPVRHLILWPLAVVFIAPGISTLRHDADWSGWLALAIGLGILVTFVVLEIRRLVLEGRGPQ